MCGIFGVIQGLAIDTRIFSSALNRSFSRGPDDLGVWFCDSQKIAFGHRRLAIINQTPDSEQPFSLGSEYGTLTYNGEIYNFEGLKKLISDWWTDHRPDDLLRTAGDTDVLYALLEKFGVSKAVSLIDGMFAFAYLDRYRTKLHLVRDSFGEKPLYFFKDEKTFVFASEMKPIHHYLRDILEVDKFSCEIFKTLGHLPGNKAIYQKMNKVSPSQIVVVDLIAERSLTVSKNSYDRWADSSVLGNASQQSFEHLLRNSVKERLAADCKKGVLLSGGIDSSIIALMAKSVDDSQAISSYTIGFSEAGFDESSVADKVARHLGLSNHRTLVLSGEQALGYFRNIANVYDEPFGDSSQIPTMAVSELASRDGAKVVLGGDGADELFGGYVRYRYAIKVSRLIRHLPKHLRRALRLALLWLTQPNQVINNLYNKLPMADPINKLQKLASILETDDLKSLYQRLVFSPQIQWADTLSEELFRRGGLAEDGFDELFNEFGPEAMQIYDFITYLPNDILHKTDRAGMGYSLEIRSPFLHPAIVNRGISDLSNANKIYPDKKILKDILLKSLPSEIVTRKKQGFGIPLSKWLRVDFQSEVTRLVAESKQLNKVGLMEDFDDYHIAFNCQQTTYDSTFYNYLILIQWMEKYA